jgi:hypothetical protein
MLFTYRIALILDDNIHLQLKILQAEDADLVRVSELVD